MPPEGLEKKKKEKTIEEGSINRRDKGDAERWGRVMYETLSVTVKIRVWD